jgi:hypothetical protein
MALRDTSVQQYFDFIFADIQLAFTFCEVARTTQEKEVARRNIENAEKAFATASKAISGSDIPERQVRILQAQLIKLRAKIADLDGRRLGRRSSLRNPPKPTDRTTRGHRARSSK